MTPRMSVHELRAVYANGKKAGRIRGARRTRVGDIWFDSALEAVRYAELILLQKAGLIADLKWQVKIPLVGQLGPMLTPTGRQKHYIADFTYRDLTTGQSVIEDTKGYRTERYLEKISALNAMGITVREIERRQKRKRK